jgi:hypothetical protein
VAKVARRVVSGTPNPAPDARLTKSGQERGTHVLRGRHHRLLGVKSTRPTRRPGHFLARTRQLTSPACGRVLHVHVSVPRSASPIVSLEAHHRGHRLHRFRPRRLRRRHPCRSRDGIGLRATSPVRVRGQLPDQHRQRLLRRLPVRPQHVARHRLLGLPAPGVTGHAGRGGPPSAVHARLEPLAGVLADARSAQRQPHHGVRTRTGAAHPDGHRTRAAAGRQGPGRAAGAGRSGSSPSGPRCRCSRSARC